MHDYTLENAKCHESPTEFSKVSSAWEITLEIAGNYFRDSRDLCWVLTDGQDISLC